MNTPVDQSVNGQVSAKEQIRFAVVLNGGVSLAVWMGGVVREIVDVTRQNAIYGRLLHLLDADARADVIAGTSAGGINGAALALSQANHSADVGLMRDLWAEQGRMDSLLQRPFRGSPSSLLRGDDYFLPKIYQAMLRMSKPWNGTTKDENPLELIITTTLLHGTRTVTVDSLGQQLPQMLHQGTFTFKRPDSVIDKVRDDFRPDLAAALAIASRCTASFPVAFEPCFVRAKDKPDKPGVEAAEPSAARTAKILDLTDPDQRPDLGRFVSWRTAGPAEALPDDRSRYAADGGLLANTPTQAALDAVGRMPASGLVQRVMLLVYPHAPVNQPDQPDRAADPPTVTGAMGGLFGALLGQGNRTFVDEIEKHNQASASRRGTRLDVMDGIRGAFELQGLAATVFGQYRNQRVRRAARDLATRVDPPVDWSFERIRRAAGKAQHSWLAIEHGQVPADVLPYVPAAAPTEDAPRNDYWPWGTTTALDLADTAMDLLHRLLAIQTDPEMCKTLATARRLVSQERADLAAIRDRLDDRWTSDKVLTTLHPGVAFWTYWLAQYDRSMTNADKDGTVLAQAEQALMDTELELCEGTQVSPDDRRTELAAAFKHLSLLTSRDIVPADDPDPTSAEGPDEPAAEKNKNRSEGWKAATAVHNIVDALMPALKPLKDAQSDGSDGLMPWQRLFADLPVAVGADPTEADHQKVLARLLWLHVAVWTLADDSDTGSSHPVDLVQISLQTQNQFAEQSVTLDDKVGGMSLNRFGGFLKRSWRMNDWTWGRMDAATMLCQIILSPERLHRRAIRKNTGDGSETAAEFVDKLIGELYAGPLPAGLAESKADAIRQLEKIYAPGDTDLPSSLPHLAALAAWAVHMRIAIEELPVIAAAVQADLNERANESSKGQLFVHQNQELLTSLTGAEPNPDGPLSEAEVDLAMRALRAFDRAGIGREPIEEEARSDQLIRTAVTAASVGVSVADSSRSGLGVIKPVTRALRGGMLVPYWTVLGLAAGGAIARFLALLTLMSGALLLALSLLGVIDGWAAGPATAIGIGAVLTAFGFAALRTGTLLHSVVLLTPVIPLGVIAVQRWQGDSKGTAHAVGTAGIIVVLTLALMVLGSMPAHLASPVATLYRWLDGIDKRYFPAAVAMAKVTGSEKLGRRLRALAIWLARIVAVVVALGLIVAPLVLLVIWVIKQPAKWQADPLWVSVVAAGIVLAGWVVGYWTGWRLRSWADLSDGSGPSEYQMSGVSHAGGVAATWSVIYGTVYAVLAAVIVWLCPANPSPAWRTALATAVVFSLLLLFVVPFAVLIGSVRSIIQHLIKDARHAVIRWPAAPDAKPDGTPGDPAEQAKAVVSLLCKNDLSFRCLLTLPKDAACLELTRGGHRLRKRVTNGLKVPKPPKPDQPQSGVEAEVAEASGA